MNVSMEQNERTKTADSYKEKYFKKLVHLNRNREQKMN